MQIIVPRRDIHSTATLATIPSHASQNLRHSLSKILITSQNIIVIKVKYKSSISSNMAAMPSTNSLSH